MIVKTHHKRKRGGQPGNQNARKHGFYSRVLTAAQQEDIPAAAAVDGLDYEIAVLRVKVRSILASDPQNHRVLEIALASLAGLLRTRQVLHGRGRRETKDLYRSFVSWLETENQSHSD